MPTLTDFQKLRSGYKEEFELYSMENRATMLFYKVFLPCVGSVKIFGNHVFQKKLSSIFSISQEGYVLLELSNNYRVWMIRAMQKYGNCDANNISETQYNLTNFTVAGSRVDNYPRKCRPAFHVRKDNFPLSGENKVKTT